MFNNNLKVEWEEHCIQNQGVGLLLSSKYFRHPPFLAKPVVPQNVVKICLTRVKNTHYNRFI